eukprot:COSAG01_NODE_4173_length_5269_cov_7.276015_1_plen_281_part_10
MSLSTQLDRLCTTARGSYRPSLASRGIVLAGAGSWPPGQDRPCFSHPANRGRSPPRPRPTNEKEMLAVRLGLVGALATLGSPAQQYKCGSCPLSLNYKTKCSKCPINHQNKCHPTARGTKVIVAGCIWAKNNHQRGIGILAAAKLYPKGSSKWKAVACEYECACMCASTPGCLSFDFRSADNKLCRMYKAPTRKANVPCRFNQHHWTKGSCSSSPSPPPAPPPAPGCPAYHAKYSKSKGGAFVTPIVTQTAYGNNGATFQLSVLLEGQAASLYSIHGTSKG